MALHIGKEIEQKYKESGIKLSEFAKRISTTTRNVYDIFERSEIKTDQLERISKVLNFNFFTLYQGSTNLVEEPEARYYTSKSRNSVSILVELDGKDATLHQLIDRLTAINKTLA